MDMNMNMDGVVGGKKAMDMLHDKTAFASSAGVRSK
jgi:hypothetical protein